MKETNTDSKDIEAIGFDFPGQVDYKTGVVKLAPNIPGWVNVPIAQMIEEEFHIPTKIDNDVRCAALGEMKFGAGRGCENFICITVGTGIGSGIVINGQLVRGAANAAGEIGHIKTSNGWRPYLRMRRYRMFRGFCIRSFNCCYGLRLHQRR